jgi:hypothetical protein
VRMQIMQLIITDGRRCGKRGYPRDRIELCALQLEYGADTSDCIVRSESHYKVRRVERWQKWGL